MPKKVVALPVGEYVIDELDSKNMGKLAEPGCRREKKTGTSTEKSTERKETGQ